MDLSKILLDNFDTVWIFLNAFVSLETELPICVKSMLFKAPEVFEGDNNKWAGVPTCPVLFFNW
jgi:hypothetical protein